jgi:diphthamide synthase (EF-2-diphthine--ammonia ligase)
MALERLRRDPSIRVEGLLTTFSRDFGLVQMHGVRRELLLEQADAVGLPLVAVDVPSPPVPDEEGLGAFPSNMAYESAFRPALARARDQGIEGIAFGDIFLADLRRYRESLLAGTGLGAVFPLWGEDTAALLRGFLESRFRATIVCVDETRLSADWAGRELDAGAAASLPGGVDPCGENGEYHTFVHDGPGFSREVAFDRGIRVHRSPFWFADLTPCRGARGRGAPVAPATH